MKIDTISWKEFKYGGKDGIFYVKKGYYNKKPEHFSSNGDIPFIGATDKNNGVTEYYTYDEINLYHKDGTTTPDDISKKIFPANCIAVTNNGSVGYAYYQTTPFTCSHDVNPLYLKNHEMNEYIALFLITVIEKDRYRWAYGRKWRPERMEKSVIKLPVDNDGNPDWKYMENYIKSINHGKITSKNTTNYDLKSIQCADFIFENLNPVIYKAKAYNKVDIDEIKCEDEPYICYISRTENDNGCEALVLNSIFEGEEEGNAITVGDTTSTVNYQSEKFICGDHMVIIRADWLNKYTGLYICTLFKQERYRYSYGRAFTMDNIKKTILRLPVDSNGNPDWQFMEDYIKSLPYGDRI